MPVTAEQLYIDSRRRLDSGDIPAATLVLVFEAVNPEFGSGRRSADGHGDHGSAIEHIFNARTVYLSKFNEPVARVSFDHSPTPPISSDVGTPSGRPLS